MRRSTVLAWPGLPDGATLKEIGVRRLSAGSGIGKSVTQPHATRWRQAFLADGSSEPFNAGPLANPGRMNGDDAQGD